MTWFLENKPGELWVEGEINCDNVDQFCVDLLAQLQAQKPQRLQLLDLEIIDGVSMTKVVNVLRAHTPIVLVYAPQMLAHTCYKCNLLLPSKITLEEPRQG